MSSSLNVDVALLEDTVGVVEPGVGGSCTPPNPTPTVEISLSNTDECECTAESSRKVSVEGEFKASLAASVETGMGRAVGAFKTGVEGGGRAKAVWMEGVESGPGTGVEGGA